MLVCDGENWAAKLMPGRGRCGSIGDLQKADLGHHAVLACYGHVALQVSSSLLMWPRGLGVGKGRVRACVRKAWKLGHHLASYQTPVSKVLWISYVLFVESLQTSGYRMG